MDGHVPRWVRIGLVVLALPQIATGVWAIVATRSWFDDFPGFGPSLVAAEPPYNAHLAADAGAGFLAIGVALFAAAAWAERRSVYVALLAYATFALPHVTYHLRHPADALSGVEQLLNAAAIGSGVGLAAVLAWGCRQRPVRSSTTSTGGTDDRATDVLVQHDGAR